MENKDSFLQLSQYHCCWWPSDTKSQDISSHCTDLVIAWYSCFSMRRVLKIKAYAMGKSQYDLLIHQLIAVNQPCNYENSNTILIKLSSCLWYKQHPMKDTCENVWITMQLILEIYSIAFSDMKLEIRILLTANNKMLGCCRLAFQGIWGIQINRMNRSLAYFLSYQNIQQLPYIKQKQSWRYLDVTWNFEQC